VTKPLTVTEFASMGGDGLRLLTDWNGELQADHLASHIGRNAADELTVA
jgi:hypothetical protein